MRIRSLLVAVAALAGCSLSLKTDKLDPLKDATGYCQTLFDQMLQLETRCHPATQQSVEIQYAQLKTACASLGALEGSTVTYDEGAARAFITTVQNASCADDFDVLFNDAGAALHGNVRDGGACSDNIECADRGAECATPDLQCPGTCLSPGRPGEPCDNGYPRCDVGYWCNSGICATAIPTGTSCLGNEGACGTGSYCYFNGTTEVCAKYAAEGSPCTDDKQCDPETDRPGLFCDDVSGSWTCKRIGSVSAGQRCKIATPYDGPRDVCGGYTFCEVLENPSAVSPVCKLKYGSSSSCEGDYLCMPPLACVGNSPGFWSGTCAPRKNLGEACDVGSNDCVGGAYCDGSGICAPLPSALGEVCGNTGGSEWAGCLVGWCDAAFDSWSYCQPYLSTGAVCSSDFQCGSGGPFSGRCEWWGNYNVCVPDGCLGN